MNRRLLSAAALLAAGLGVAFAGCIHGKDCDIVECVETCDGPVVFTNCVMGGCVEGTFDRTTCPIDVDAGCGECLHATQCVQICGGPVLGTGCCPCPSAHYPYFDKSTCGDAGCGECDRTIFCVETCGGPELVTGCCPCPEGMFDDILCADGGTGPDDGGDGG